MNTIWDRLDTIIELEFQRGAEVGLKLDVVTECLWGGELRYTPKPNNPDGPDRSYVFYSAGEKNPEETTRKLLYDFLSWQESIQEK